MDSPRGPLRQNSLQERSTDSLGSLQSFKSFQSFQSGASSSSRSRVDMRQIALTSAPEIVLEKAVYTNLGRTKKLSLAVLRVQEGKSKSEGMMADLHSDHKPRFAREEKVARENKAKRHQPHIEVMEVEGNTLLGVPGTSRLSQYTTIAERGRTKHVLIAMHDTPRAKGKGGLTHFAFCCTLVDVPCPSCALRLSFNVRE